MRVRVGFIAVVFPARGVSQMGIPKLLHAIKAVAVVIVILGVSAKGKLAVVETKAKMVLDDCDCTAAITDSD